MLKSHLLLACACLMGAISFAQITTVDIAADNVDTTVKYVDFSGRVQNRETAPFIQKTWPENGKYLLHLYANDNANRLLRKTTYADAALQILDGPFENYFDNGRLKDSGSYSKKMRHGTFKTWYESGSLMSIYRYANGMRVDTGKLFTESGELAALSVADQQGNGTETTYYPGGGIHATGPLTEGVKNGIWILKRENGTNKMQVDFIRDSVAQTTCFGEDGNTPANGPCIYERFAQFPGGMNGWRNYLMKNLKYPKVAIDRDIQGTVMLEFMVDTDGTIRDIKVVSSPHESLTNEALRLMNLSPKWEPAIQYNKTVKGRLRQPFNFRLQ